MGIYTNKNLSSTDKLIYGYLNEITKLGISELSFKNEDLAIELGVHQVSVSNSLKRLQEEGLIKMEYHKNGVNRTITVKKS